MLQKERHVAHKKIIYEEMVVTTKC